MSAVRLHCQTIALYTLFPLTWVPKNGRLALICYSDGLDIGRR